MKVINGNIWDWYNQGYWIAITTNGTIKKNGECVLGKGIALQAKNKFPELPFYIGQKIQDYGNIPLVLNTKRIITFPVKYNWWEKADLELIERSCKSIGVIVTYLIEDKLLYKNILMMPKPGCGNGNLDWKDVEPILDKCLPQARIIICDLVKE